MSKIVLTEEQKSIVEDSGSPLRVLAGPGTGKTLCIIEKVVRLINEQKVSPKTISVITFTKATAAELRDRLERAGIKPDLLPHANTLHGFAMSILKSHQGRTHLKPNFQPVHAIMQRIIVKDTTEDLKHIGVKLGRAEPKSYMHACQQKKSKAGIPCHLSESAHKEKIFEQFTQAYHENLRFYNAIDWADILALVIELMENHGDIRKEVHAKTSHLLVDDDLPPENCTA